MSHGMTIVGTVVAATSRSITLNTADGRETYPIGRYHEMRSLPKPGMEIHLRVDGQCYARWWEATGEYVQAQIQARNAEWEAMAAAAEGMPDIPWEVGA